MPEVAPPLVLVTGAAGFVGQALCRTLAEAGFRVRGATRRPAAGIEAAAVGEIGPDTDWRAALHGVDAVVHLAARVHVMRDTAADPEQAFHAVNAAGTERLARQAAAAGVRRLVYVSSVKVNGERTAARPFDAADAAAPQDPYGRSKWAAEQALQAVSRESGLETVAVRPPLVYGPGVGGNFLRLMKLVKSGVPLPLASLRNRRSLIYLGNLVDLLALCLRHPEAAGATFLVSDGEDLSTGELVRRLARALGRPPRLLPCPPALLRLAGTLAGRGDEVARLADSLQVDDGALRRRLGWSPPFTVDQGIAASAAWFDRA